MAAILLNWRTPDLTLGAVSRALEQLTPPDHVFVVENGSGDDSARRLAEALKVHGERVSLVVNDRNLGFGGGCNSALREVLSRDFQWAWLLNNDAEPAPDCLHALLEASEREMKPGLVGTSMIDPIDADRGHYGNWLDPMTLHIGAVRSQLDLTQHRLSWLTAASLLVSTEALREVGLFDEDFFMYWEDADLNVRIRRASYDVVAAPGALAVHQAGTSSSGMKTQRYLWHFASQRRFLKKHHPWPSAVRVLLRFRYLLGAVVHRDLSRARAILSA